MPDETHDTTPHVHHGCCDCTGCASDGPDGLSRREFLAAAGIVLGSAALEGLGWAEVASAAAAQPAAAPRRKALVVKPILSYSTPRRREAASWREWGGIQTQEHADAEVARIRGELDKLRAAADFPVTFLPVMPVRGDGDLKKADDLDKADAIILYAAGGRAVKAVAGMGKPVIYFVRHRSGPVYLWYEIINPFHVQLRPGELAGDMVVDSADELLWRLRALCGLNNALGTRIIAIGGPGTWGGDRGALAMARSAWKLDIRTVDYRELAALLKAANEDAAAIAAATAAAEAYLKDPAVKLETKRPFVDKAFLLDAVFRGLMAKADCRAITVNACMGTIMGVSETTACLTLSTLNDAGYMAFCESDFVVIPAGILLCCITGRPHFLNDPTFPHAGVITLAHCTAPRRMNGKAAEPARILTHFESDYGAAPKVEMARGTKVTCVIPDFAGKRYLGFVGEIADAPFLDICRSQIDVAYKFPDDKLAFDMPGFHWEVVYGDCTREMGYALRKLGIAWEVLA